MDKIRVLKHIVKQAKSKQKNKGKQKEIQGKEHNKNVRSLKKKRKTQKYRGLV